MVKVALSKQVGGNEQAMYPAHTFSIVTYLFKANLISLQAPNPWCELCPSLTVLTEFGMISRKGGILEAGRRGKGKQCTLPTL